MGVEPVRSPVVGTLHEALEVALAYQRLASLEHEAWPVGVAWGSGATAAYVQWSHDPPGPEAPDGFLGLLEVGVAVAAVDDVAPALTALGFDLGGVDFGDTRVLAWTPAEDLRRIGDDDVVLAHLERAARATGAPPTGRFELYPDA